MNHSLNSVHVSKARNVRTCVSFLPAPHKPLLGQRFRYLIPYCISQEFHKSHQSVEPLENRFMILPNGVESKNLNFARTTECRSAPWSRLDARKLPAKTIPSLSKTVTQ